MSRSIAVLRKVKAGGKGRGLLKASNDEQLLLIHDTEKILGHHDRYFPGGKPLDFAPSALLPQLDSDEIILHDIVKSRNIDGLILFLENSPKVNINCTDYDCNTALVLAVKNGDANMVELLLEFDDIEVNDALLHAIQLGHYRIVEMLLDKQSEIGETSGAPYLHSSPAFPPDITPLELAAMNRKYKLIKLLLSKGNRIEFPHALQCNCTKCEAMPDALERAWSRLRTYEAISSPEYICQTSNDPILSAFELSGVFLEQAELNDGAFREQYFALATKCSDFAVDLLSQCRTVEEVELILHRRNEPDESGKGRPPGKWERMSRAMEYEQRKFVAHPNCQQILQLEWEEGFNETGKIFGSKMLFLLSRVVTLPVLFLIYILFPNSSSGRAMRAPTNKFYNFYASYLAFIIILTAQSELTKRHHDHRGPPDSGLEWPLILFVLGFSWRSFRLCWRLGRQKYFSNHWHKYDMFLQGIFGMIFFLWAYSWFDVTVYGNKFVDRKEWKATEPTLLSEGIFAFATVVAFCKLFYFFQTGHSLGPLIVSFSRMFKDISEFMQIYLCVLVSFSLGMARLYFYYKGQIKHSQGETETQSSLFLGFSDAISTLFWSIYGLLPYESLEIVVGETHSNESSSETGETEMIEHQHRLTQTVAFTLYGLYSMIGITVLINLLIAMMSNSYAKVEDNADNEWKFARTGVWIIFMEQCATLPPPYNLVSTLKEAIVHCCRCCKQWKKTNSGSFWGCFNADEELNPQDDEKYTQMMKNLVQRYLTSKYHIMQLKRVTVSNVNDLKQEIVQAKNASNQVLDLISARGTHKPQKTKLSSNIPRTNIPPGPDAANPSSSTHTWYSDTRQ